MRAHLILSGLIVLGLFSGGCSKSKTKLSNLQDPVQAAPTNQPMNLVAKVHFIGTAALMADTNAATRLKEIADLPATTEARELILQKLAMAPYRLLQKKIAPGSKDEAASIRPLLEDLLQREFYLEARGTSSIPELKFWPFN